MAKTYEAITSQTLGTTTASVTFSAIPQTYTDLILIIQGTTTGNSQLMMRFNGVSTTTYSATNLGGTGATSTSTRFTNATSMQLGYNDYFQSSQSHSISHILDYTNASYNKSVISRTNNAAIGVGISAGLSRSTSAVTSITVFPLGSSWASGTTFSLYGVKA